MRRHLHHRVGCALPQRFIQDSVEIQRLGGGMWRGQNFAGHVILNRSDQRAFAPRCRQNRFHQERYCSFPVRPGDAGHGQPLRRLLVKVRAQSRQCSPAVRYYRPRYLVPRLLRGRIRDHAYGAGLDRLINKAVPVAALSAHGYKHTSRLHAPRVIFDTAHSRVSALPENLRTIQKLLEGHCQELYGTIDSPTTAGSMVCTTNPHTSISPTGLLTICLPPAFSALHWPRGRRNQHLQVPLRPM